jgi:hypothetical protein
MTWVQSNPAGRESGVLVFCIKDRTPVQFERTNVPIEVLTLYQLVRKLEAQGNTKVDLSHHKINRPEQRQPGQRDFFELTKD